MSDPEATETFQKLPTHSRSFRNFPEASDTFQKLPKHSKNYQHTPGTTEAFQKLPKHSGNYRHIPRRHYRKIPETTDTFQNLYRIVLETADTFQKLQKHSRSYRCRNYRGKIPKHSRNYRNIPEERNFCCPHPHAPVPIYTSMPSPLYGILFSYRCPPACRTRQSHQCKMCGLSTHSKPIRKM